MAGGIWPVAMRRFYITGCHNRGRCDGEQARIVAFVDDRFVVEGDSREWSAFASVQSVHNV